MPITKRRTPAEDAASALIQVAADPKKYQERLDELADRRIAVEEAEADVAAREKQLTEREVACNAAFERSKEMTGAAGRRLQEAGKAEGAVAEREVAVVSREVAVAEREVDVTTREEALEAERGHALAAVKKLLTADLEALRGPAS